MRTLNSIALEYLLRNDSQQNNHTSEEVTRETTRIEKEQNVKQKSLLFQLYELEEEAEEFLA
ncbi:hypothetical protein [Flavobacterium ginsenosidimutans]|uniref:Uncharacterized protein n=1 Tax=Flavobacterium ginsenosidimutans TaxID=687844 RepID=A0ABZ2QBI5_9FLAO|nr:hypothetical protein [Flavobacterium ginsenosidimutans]KAF2329656.1 hypothetical protein DM444_15530 [Flavobacterium ginsenosidimutans]